MILGPTGSGKELVARALHKTSDRRARPLVAVHCGAIPAELIESELFGHLKGSFTGAHADRAGLIAAADGGTLFLDEIGETPLVDAGQAAAVSTGGKLSAGRRAGAKARQCPRASAPLTATSRR